MTCQRRRAAEWRNPFYLEVLDTLHETLRTGEVRMLVLTPGRDRERGFRAVLGETGVELAPKRWRRTPFDFEAERRLTLELLESRPTAIFCANDVLALGAHDAISGRGLRIPQDITLIGFDDVLLARWQAFQLTTVSQDIGQMVQVCTELLLERIAAGPDAAPEPRRVVLPARLIRRATQGPPVS